MRRVGIALALVATLGVPTAFAQAPDEPAPDEPAPDDRPSEPPATPAPAQRWPGLVPGVPLVSDPRPGPALALPPVVRRAPVQPAPPEPPPEAPSESATEACGSNRRCRLARLRARARQRRFDRAERVHLGQRREQELRERARLSRVLREKAPFTMGPLVTDIRGGGIFGLHVHPNLWAGVLITGAYGGSSFLSDANRRTSVNLNTVAVLGAEVRWVMLTGPLSPYLSAGFDVMVGRANYFDFVFASGTRASASTSVEIHYARGGLGLDLQLDFGLRIRAGFLLRPLIYVRFREGGEPVRPVRDAFVEGWSILGGEGTIGWAL